MSKWRAANPYIVQLWDRMNKLAIHTIDTGDTTYLNGLTLRSELDIINVLKYFTIELPSGRKLFYCSPGLGTNRWGHPSTARR